TSALPSRAGTVLPARQLLQLWRRHHETVRRAPEGRDTTRRLRHLAILCRLSTRGSRPTTRAMDLTSWRREGARRPRQAHRVPERRPLELRRSSVGGEALLAFHLTPALTRAAGGRVGVQREVRVLTATLTT